MPRRQSGLRWARKLALLAAPVVLLGEAGHHLLERYPEVLAHHLFHILFGAGAVVAFVAFLAVDIRRNGVPSFSFRLGPARPRVVAPLQPASDPSASGRVAPAANSRC